MLCDSTRISIAKSETRQGTSQCVHAPSEPRTNCAAETSVSGSALAIHATTAAPPAKLPTVAWINQPNQEALIQPA
jgi:hypothetical protein